MWVISAILLQHYLTFLLAAVIMDIHLRRGLLIDVTNYVCSGEEQTGPKKAELDNFKKAPEEIVVI